MTDTDKDVERYAALLQVCAVALAPVVKMIMSDGTDPSLSLTLKERIGLLEGLKRVFIQGVEIERATRKEPEPSRPLVHAHKFREGAACVYDHRQMLLQTFHSGDANVALVPGPNWLPPEIIDLSDLDKLIEAGKVTLVPPGGKMPEVKPEAAKGDREMRAAVLTRMGLPLDDFALDFTPKAKPAPKTPGVVELPLTAARSK